GEALAAEGEPHAVIQWLAVAADGDLETASNEEPLIVDDACVVGKHDAARPLALGNREILRGEIPAEARNSLVERTAARALEAKGLGILKDNRRLNRLRHRILRLEALPQKTIRSEEHTSELQSLAYLVCRLLL